MKIQVEKRLTSSKLVIYLVPTLSLLISLLSGALLLLATGVDPITAYQAMFIGAFGSFYKVSEVFVKAIPLILCGLAVAIAARMHLWNIGCEGQLAIGGIAASGIALFLAENIPVPLVIPTMVASGFIAGALWALIPGVLKAKMGVSEIITSLMLNYIAILWLEHLYFGPWRDPMGRGFPGTAMFPDVAWLPRFFRTRVHLGLVFGLVMAGLIWFILSYTRWGYEIRIIGESPGAARYARINIVKNVILVMFLSGGLAGMAGMAEVSGIYYRLQQGLTVGYGYIGIIVAWLSRLNPWAVIVVAFLLASLLVGGDQLQMVLHLPSAIGLVLEGILLFSVLGCGILTRYRIRIK